MEPTKILACMKVNLKLSGVIILSFIMLCYGVFFYSQHNAPRESTEKIRLVIQGKKPVDPEIPSPTAQPNSTLRKENKATPPLIRQLLDEIYQISDITVRATKSGEAIKALCLAGFQEEAWSLILENPGLVRNRQLIDYFASTHLTSYQFCEKYGSLRGNGEAQLALKSWLGNFETAELLSMLDIDKGNSDLLRARESDKELFSSGVATYFELKLRTNSFEPSEAARNLQQENLLYVASALLGSGVLDPSSVQSLIRVVKFDDPFKKWDYLNSISNPATEPFLDLEGGRSQTISDMVRTNANDTLEKFKDLDSAVYLHKAVKSWISLDAAQAGSWYKDNKLNLTSSLQSAAASAFFQTAMDYREMESAVSWAQEIKDPELKAKALKSISDKLAASATKN